MLPSVTAAAPSPSNAKPAATAFDMQDFLDTPGPGRKAPAKKRGRGLKRLVMLALLGAGGWAAQEYGPALYDQYVGDGTEIAPPEATAPLAFPNITSAATHIRTAEFILDGLPETPGVTYRVTTDFETDVSQVDITRVDGPDLQILTYANDAMIRRADGDQWYVLERGQFPLDGRLDRSDWVRRIDELLPTDVRHLATIAESTESTISGVPTRHLSLTVDPALLGTAAAAAAPLPVDAAVDAGDGLTAPVVEPLELDSTISATGVAVTSAATAPPVGTIAIEIWIDGNGLVRQVTGAPQLGAQTITILRTSAEAWIPQYPTPDEIAPLTASALVELGV